jgi:hypothetical protein
LSVHLIFDFTLIEQARFRVDEMVGAARKEHEIKFLQIVRSIDRFVEYYK